VPLEPSARVAHLKAMLGPTLADALGPRGREALLSGSFLLAMADGQLADEEFAWITALSDVLGIDGDDIEVISGEIDRNEIADRLSTIELTISQRNAVLAMLGVIAKADRELADSEWKLIYGIGASLGRSPRDCENVVNRVTLPR
jgi:uncharacterized tellurite resistance protein B-like protein